MPLNAVLQVQDPALRAIEWPVLVQIVVWVLDLHLGITLMALGRVLWGMRGVDQAEAERPDDAEVQ